MFYCFFLIYSHVSFYQNWSNIFHCFAYDVFVVNKSNVIFILLVNYSQLWCFCPILCSNCGHEDAQWVLETHYVHYDNYDHIDELVFLLIMNRKGTV